MPSFSWTVVAPPATVDTGLSDSLGATSDAVEGIYRRDFLLDDDGDLELSTGDVQWVTGIEAIAQEALLSLSQVMGEWFLDLEDGIPLFEEVLVENPNIERIRDLYRQRLLTVTGVVSVTGVSADFDRLARELSLEATCQTDLGAFNLEASVP